jgi:hypothetical protein
MALGVDIVSAFDGTGIKKAIEEFKLLKTNGEKAQFAIQKAAIPAAAALAGLTAGLGLAVKGAMADQEASEKLAFTLRNLTDATQEEIDANEDFLKSQERTTMFNNAEMRPSLDALIRTTGDVGKAQKSLTLAMDISAATGQSLTSVSTALARAHTGNFAALQKLDPMLRQNIKEGASLNEVFGQLSNTFGGATAAASATAAGQMAILRNQTGALSDSIGAALLPIVTAILPVFTRLAEFATNNTEVFLALAGIVGILATAILAANAAIKLKAAGLVLMKVAAAAATAVNFALATSITAVQLATGIGIAVVVAASAALAVYVAGQKKLQAELDATTAATEKNTDATEDNTEAIGRNRTLTQIANEARLRATLGQFDAMRMANAGADATEKLNKATGGASKTVATFTDKLNAYTSALKGNFDAQRAATSATNSRISAEKAMGAASQNTLKAQERFNHILKGFPKTSREATEATRDFERAQKRVGDAQDSQRDAVERVIEAEKKLAALRAITADPEDVADAERGLERSKYRVEQANFSVIEAEQELKDLRLDPEASAIAIRRAEIRLAEAKLGVTESVNSVKDAELKLKNEINRAATAEQIADAERDLRNAKESVTDQTDALRDATYEEAIAQDLLNQVLHGASEETDIYQEALRGLTDAKEAEEDARRQVAEAILAEAESTLALAAAIKELNKVSAVSPPKVISRGQTALAGISTANPALASLNRVNAPTGGTTPPINVTVNAGLGSDPDSITRGLLDMFKQYERANGSLPLTVSNAVAFG